MARIVDRIGLARSLCYGKRVLDIGGALMPDTKGEFLKQYLKLRKSCKEYKIVDYKGADVLIDFNDVKSIKQIRKVIDSFKPEVILCMETLEHINYHQELMTELARAVEKGARVLVSLPNNSNWVVNFMGWNKDHSISFVRDVADRFVGRSALGKYKIRKFRCIGKYIWYWRLVYWLSFFQPVSIAYVIEK